MKTENKIFVVLVVVALLICATFAIVSPTIINTYENRYAQKMPIPSLNDILSNEFQNDVEIAVADQLPLASKLKKAYNLVNSFFIVKTSSFYVQMLPDKYVKCGGINFFGKNLLVYSPIELEEIEDKLAQKVQNLNQTFQDNSTVDFYVYFIEKDTDINFDTGTKQGLKEYVFAGLDLPDQQKLSFEINSIDEFKNYFYSTDHHWNYKGAYKAYCDLIQSLKPSDQIMIPTEETLISGKFFGSKNSSLGYNFFGEDFRAYEFDYCDMSIAIDGEPATDYGNQEDFLNGVRSDIAYGSFYGGDEGEIVFSTQDTTKENILVIGESFDNAILKLLATHFNSTHSIDLRYYENSQGHKFDLQSYIQSNNIDKVLLIGNVNYFSSSDFALE